MLGLLGPHVNRGVPEVVARWKPPVAVVLDHNEGWRGVKAASPGTRLIGRIVSDHQPDFNQDLDPVQAARDHVASMLHAAARMRGVYDWWIGVNEPGIDSAEAMARYCRFEQERMNILAEHGIRAALGSFAVGNPWNMAWWAQFVPALKQGRAMGAVLALHQYWWNAPNDVWTAFRHEKVWKGEPSHGWPGLAEDAQVPVVLTECGRDIGVDQNGVLGGWRDELNESQYLAELRAFNARLEQAPYVIGATVFCLNSESWNWTGYDIAGPLVEKIAAEARPLYRNGQGGGSQGTVVSRRRDGWEIVDLVKSLNRHPKKRYETRNVDDVTRTVLHHTGVAPKRTDMVYIKQYIGGTADYHIRTKDWPGIGYHFMVDPRGRIFQVNREETISYHAGKANGDSYGVALIGQFDLDEDPTEDQLAAAVWLCQRLGKPVVPHKALSATRCPGHWERWGARFQI